MGKRQLGRSGWESATVAADRPPLEPTMPRREVEILSGAKYPHTHVQLTGYKGDQHELIATVARALKGAGASRAEIHAYRIESLSGDYDHVIATAKKWVNVS